MTQPLRLLAVLIAGAVAIAAVKLAADARKPPEGSLLTADGDTVMVSSAARAAGLRFAVTVPADDQRWILAAVAAARPEAARLIAEVDGMVTIGALPPGSQSVLGLTSASSDGITVDLALDRLDYDRALDRNVVVLHELGHVIDVVLVPKDLDATLDAGIPHGGPCGLAEGCEAPQERFADTFAKWALGGAVSELGAGYGIPMPPSIETWGAPLGALATQLPRT
jgi:hypothetical protein